MDSFTSPLVIAGASTALVAGATGSLHCALMCGPLACASLPSERRRSAAVGWHLGRLGGYAIVGALLGALGTAASAALTVRVTPYLPWLMAAGLIATALELGKHLRPLPGVAAISRALASLGRRTSPVTRSTLLGVATPFLPCGLLYGVFLAALASSSIWGGAVIMGAFALGAVPALVAVQAGARWTNRWPTLSWALRKAVPLFAAGVLIWRAVTAAQRGPDCH